MKKRICNKKALSLLLVAIMLLALLPIGALADVAELEAAVTAAGEAVATAEGAVDRAQAALDSARTALSEAQAAANSAPGNVTSAQSALDSANSALSAAQSTLSNTPAAGEAPSTAAKDAAAADVETARNAKSAADEAAAADPENADLQAAAANAATALANAENAYSDAENAYAPRKEAYDSAKAAHDAASSAVTAAQADVERATSALAAANDAAAAAPTNLSNAETAVTSAESTLTGALSTLATAENNLDAAQAALDNANIEAGTSSRVTVPITWPGNAPSGTTCTLSATLTYTPDDGSDAGTVQLKKIRYGAASANFTVPLAAETYTSELTAVAVSNRTNFTVSKANYRITVAYREAPADQPDGTEEPEGSDTEAALPPVKGEASLSFVWNEGTENASVDVALRYALGDDSGVTAQQTVTPASATCPFADVPLKSADETQEYTHTAVVCGVSAGFMARVSGKIVTVSVDDGSLVSKTVTVNWVNVPAGENPSVSVSLPGATPMVVSGGTTTCTFYGLAKTNDAGEEIVYAASAGEVAGYHVACEGLTVTVTALATEEVTAAVGAIEEKLNELGPVYANDMDWDNIEFDDLDAYAEKIGLHTEIGRMLAALSEAQRAAIDATLMAQYNAWSAYIAANAIPDMGATEMSFRNTENEPDSHPITLSGTVTFSAGSGYTVPTSVEVKLLQNGILVRSQGAAISSNSGSFNFGSWPKYNAAAGGQPYTYTVVGSPVAKFVASSAGLNVYYVSQANPERDTPTDYKVSVAWANVPASADPSATVQMYKNGAAVSGKSHTFKKSVDTGVFTFSAIPVKGGDEIRPVQSDVAGYRQTTERISDTEWKITNTYTADKTSFGGTITWLNATRFNKPSLVITIEGTPKTAGGTAITESICTDRMDADSTTYIFSELDPNYTYKIKSVTINKTYADDLNYVVAWSGSAITLSRPGNPLMRIGVTVRWVDNNNKRERRPSETTVYLYRDGVYTGDSEQVLASDGWETIFYDQPYGDGTHIYKYSIRLAKTPYYWMRYTRLSAFGFRATCFYGSGRSTDSDSSTGLTPKVGDPTLFRTALSDRMYAEAAASMRAVRNAAVLKDNENATGAVDFDTLKRMNKDVVGWVTLAGTNIDYPIVKGSNNTDYLTKLFSGESNSSGSLFMDYHNNSKFSNRNTTVFGHNMQDGSMFNTLLKYKDQSFYTAHPSFNIQTPDGSYTAEPIAAFYTDSAYSNVVKRTFANNAAFQKYVDKCIRASSIQSDVTVGATDKLVTFVTCDDDYSANRRFLVVCKLSVSQN